MNRKTLCDPAVSVAFSGHRPGKIFLGGYDPRLEEDIRNRIYITVRELYGQGYRNFITGMAPGFDIWAGFAVMLMKELPDFSGMALTCAVPFAGQRTRNDPAALRLYDDILRAADRIEMLSPDYFAGCFLRRNDWMIERSSVLVCYDNGSKGGTGYTVEKAARKGHRIINLYDCAER